VPFTNWCLPIQTSWNVWRLRSTWWLVSPSLDKPMWIPVRKTWMEICTSWAWVNSHRNKLTSSSQNQCAWYMPQCEVYFDIGHSNWFCKICIVNIVWKKRLVHIDTFYMLEHWSELPCNYFHTWQVKLLFLYLTCLTRFLPTNTSHLKLSTMGKSDLIFFSTFSKILRCFL